MYRTGPYDAPVTATSTYDDSTSRSYSTFHNNQYRTSSGVASSDDTNEAYISRTLYICKLPHDFTEAQIHAICAPFGDLRKITSYPSRQISFAEYWDIRDAQRARNELKEVYIGGRLVDIQYSKTKDDRDKDKNTGTLYVRPLTTERNFHDPNTLQQYKDLFGRYGEVKKVNTNRKREAEKFIEYHDLRAAEAALEALNGSDFNGVRLEVQFANQSSKTIEKENYVEYNATNESCSANVPPPLSRNFCKEMNVSSYGPIRGLYPPASSSQVSEPQPQLAPKRWNFSPIKKKWYGTAGPFAMASRVNNVTQGNDLESTTTTTTNLFTENKTLSPNKFPAPVQQHHFPVAR